MSKLASTLKGVSALKALLEAAKGFLTHIKKEEGDQAVMILNAPCTLSVKGRLPATSAWHNEGFMGDEPFRLESAYILDSKVFFTMQPAAPDKVIAFVRISFDQACELLAGFETEFSAYMEENGGEELTGGLKAARAAAQAEALERARIDSGNNADWGTW